MVPAVSIEIEVASFKAVAASVSPIIIATGPVTEAGRIFSIESLPNLL